MTRGARAVASPAPRRAGAAAWASARRHELRFEFGELEEFSILDLSPCVRIGAVSFVFFLGIAIFACAKSSGGGTYAAAGGATLSSVGWSRTA